MELHLYDWLLYILVAIIFYIRYRISLGNEDKEQELYIMFIWFIYTLFHILLFTFIDVVNIINYISIVK